MNKVTDPELLAILNQGSAEAPSNVVTDPELLAVLNAGQPAAPEAPVTPQKPEGSILAGVLETGATMASGALAEPLAGIYGAATGLLEGGDLNASVRNIEEARQALTYQPRTQSGDNTLQGTGELLAPVGEAFNWLSENLGDFAYDVTGSPEVAAMAYALPTAGLEFLGVKGIRSAARNTKKAKEVRSVQKQMLKDPVQKYNEDVALVKLSPRGDVVPDVLAEELVNTGMNKRSVAVITNSTPVTQKAMGEMLDTYLKTSKNSVLDMTEKTTKVIGDSVAKRLNFLTNRRKAYGNQLNEIVEGMDGVDVDLSPVVGEFVDVLKKDLGVGIRMNPVEGISIDTAGSALDLKSLGGTKRLIEDALEVVNQQANAGITTGKGAHKIKKLLDELIDTNKLSEAGVSNQTQRRLGTLRSGVNQLIGEASPEYAAINGKLSNVIQTMDPFKKYLKEGEGWGDTRVQAVVGKAMDSLKGDSQMAARLSEDVGRLEAGVRQMGMSMGDDPRALVNFRQTINQHFKLSEDEIVSQIKGLNDAAKAKTLNAVASASVGNVFGTVHDVARLRELGLSRKQAKALVEDRQKSMILLKQILK